MDDEPRLSELHEFGLIDRIAGLIGRGSAVAGIGDDAAVLLGPTTEQYLLATVDALVEQEHFDTASVDPVALGRRAIAVNVSDIAAMGGRPTSALTSIALRDDLPVRWIEDVYGGMRQETHRYGIDIVGGNVSRIRGPVVLDVTMLGAVARSDVLLRRGAEVGDALVVTGSLGGAYALRRAGSGGAHVAVGGREALAREFAVPSPPVDAAQALARARLVHAALDLSDGLASDVRRLGAASGVGARVDSDRLPVSTSTRRVARMLGIDAQEMALFGGEDYQLLLALPADAIDRASAVAAPTLLSVVGEVRPMEEGFVLRRADGRRDELAEGGWRHF